MHLEHTFGQSLMGQSTSAYRYIHAECYHTLAPYFITLCFNKFKFVYYSQAAHFTLTWLISHPCCWALHWCSLCKDISLTFVAIIFCSYDSKLFPTGALCAQHLTWIFLGSILLAKFGLMLVQLITTQRITITQLITLDGTLLVLKILVFLTPL